MYKRAVNITRIKKDEKINMQDTILVESPIDLIVNSTSLVNIICLPRDLKPLAVGFLYSIGLINNKEDIKDLKVDEMENTITVELIDSIDFATDQLEINPISRVVDTTCGISSPWRNVIKRVIDDSISVTKSKADIKVNSNLILSCIKIMQMGTMLFRETGGCHGAAIFDFNGDQLSIKEDIGRHNAIDKVLGDMILKGRDLSNTLLTSTGRLTGDSVLKAIRAKIPIVASLSAAVESGVRLAFAYNITLIGFARGSRMNIYTHPDRIIIE